MTRRPLVLTRTAGLRCITRVVVNEPKRTRGWNVRVIRRGIALTEFFSDSKFGGKARALSEAMHHRDLLVKELRPWSRAELARRKTARNTSGIPGVRRRVKPAKTANGTVLEYEVWTASGSPQPRQRKTRDFYVSKLGEDNAREAAIAQRLRWERQMARSEKKQSAGKF
ncbi:MAG TPA: hypothetical protein VF593_07430 [Chthoniobacteraceae bacterium]|jgi:hypothetical protein